MLRFFSHFLCFFNKEINFFLNKIFKLKMTSFCDLNLNVTNLNEKLIDNLVENALNCKLNGYLR